LEVARDFSIDGGVPVPSPHAYIDQVGLPFNFATHIPRTSHPFSLLLGSFSQSFYFIFTLSQRKEFSLSQKQNGM
jgi:hypothetical protein